MVKQRTLKNIIRATGVGVHTGEKVYLTLRPAPVDTGIIFVRADLDPAVEIPAKCPPHVHDACPNGLLHLRFQLRRRAIILASVNRRSNWSAGPR